MCCRLQQFLKVANHLFDFFGVSVPYAASQIVILLKVSNGCGVLLLCPPKAGRGCNRHCRNLA
jgi:hypothetical protein